MLRTALFTALLSLAGSAFAAAPSGNSAYRAPGMSYLHYMPAMSRPTHDPVSRRDFSTPAAVAVNFGEPLPDATEWESYDLMLERFKKVRDLRWMKTADQPDFPRRITWLYPDDGCFARAGLEIFNFAQWAVSLPKKVFAFGDLLVKTNNVPGGQTGWWYHVAPVVEVNKQKYVLDPSIDPLQPMKLEDWIGAMSAAPSSVRVAICGSGSYSPDDYCDKDSDGIESMALTDEHSFLYAEWSRLLELKRTPESELGDNPPWN